MFFNIIMAIGILPVFIIFYFVLKGNAKPQKGRYFSVTLKKDWLKEEATKAKIEEITARYYKELRLIFWISMLVPFICFFIPYISIQVTIWCTWLFIAIVLFYIPFLHAHKALMEWKKLQGWSSVVNPETYVELKSLGQSPCVKLSQFMVPLILTILTVGSGIAYRITGKSALVNPANEMVFYSYWILLVLSIVLFILMARYLDKKDSEVISQDSDINLNYTRARKNIWKDFWLSAAWITAGMQILTGIFLWFDSIFLNFILWSSLLFTILLLILTMNIVRRFSRVNQTYEEYMDDSLYVDDDRYWIGGIIYYNPHDNHSFVETRFGMGTTTNMAKPLGKVLDIVAVITILFSIGMCIWVVFEEFTPISLQIAPATTQEASLEDESIQAIHLGLEYEIALEEIEEITCLSKLPSMSKSNGSAMDTLYKGTFYVNDEGEKCQVFLNPQNHLFLKIKTDDEIYYIGGIDDAQTQEVYEYIMAIIASSSK